jgi:hypothetical protein
LSQRSVPRASEFIRLRSDLEKKPQKPSLFPDKAAMAAKAGGQVFDFVNNPSRRSSYVL